MKPDQKNEDINPKNFIEKSMEYFVAYMYIHVSFEI